MIQLNKYLHDELKDRARLILGLSENYTVSDIKRNFHRQIKLVHPDNIKHYNSKLLYRNKITKLIIQSYHLLIGKNQSVYYIKDDYLVSYLIGEENIVSINNLINIDKEHDNRFYKNGTMFNNSYDDCPDWKFKGI